MNVKTTNGLPLLLVNPVDEFIERGYTSIPKKFNYNAKTQVSDLIQMGETSPSTMSSVSTFLGSDDDRGTDDKGKD